ncbi:DUF4126 domain-containing protein [Flavihumibacter petaseus]|uniref:DUF4126 domain-containing protein n=1 Tax=Flavihumibacter petaseus NBRC 106054 TaxID=1220578 RepID=A0A0E9N2K2_9BACT|nr:DUF4126 domain-containing protein [Flavihumibacter petaseus]GAO44237.1 hypothetical protein FPE01S_03_02750 [Flavihumibacter petaseus NBRC 106054]
MSYFIAVCMGIALSACCGFRIFLPLLLSAVGARLGWVPLQGDMLWLAGWPAIACFGTATALEIAAYYVPFIDNLLDTIAAPLAVAAGALLAFSVFPAGDVTPLWRWGIAILAGGSIAGTIQVGSGMLRLLSTKTTAGAGNAVVATGENLAAGGGSVAAMFLPVLTAAAMVMVAGWLTIKVFRRFFSGKNGK